MSEPAGKACPTVHFHQQIRDPDMGKHSIKAARECLLFLSRIAAYGTDGGLLGQPEKFTTLSSLQTPEMGRVHKRFASHENGGIFIH
jgi:hypothetical protein